VVHWFVDTSIKSVDDYALRMTTLHPLIAVMLPAHHPLIAVMDLQPILRFDNHHHPRNQIHH
jgi:hypothetical protein